MALPKKPIIGQRVLKRLQNNEINGMLLSEKKVSSIKMHKYWYCHLTRKNEENRALLKLQHT